MPTAKRNLTKADVAKHLPRAEELRKSGVDVEIPEEWRPDSSILDIKTAAPPESLVWDISRGGVYYVVGVRLLAGQSETTLQHCEITTHWDDQIVLQSFDERKPYVEFGRHLYHQGEILNQRIEDYLRLDRGRLVEGWLLAMSLRPIPQQYRNGAIVPLQLSFWDQFEREFVAEGKLSVLRAVKRPNTALQARYGSPNQADEANDKGQARQWLSTLVR